MSSNQRSTSAAPAREKTYFEQQREELMGEIVMVCYSVISEIGFCET
jgi:hypothetical protein